MYLGKQLYIEIFKGEHNLGALSFFLGYEVKNKESWNVKKLGKIQPAE